jgi:hypothetical protein
MTDENLADDLHATSEAIVVDAKRVLEIEAQKEHLDPDDPRVHLLSVRSEKIVDVMRSKAAVETQLAKEATRRK